jgi:hypothetical protein
MVKSKILLLAVSAVLFGLTQATYKLNEEFSWKQLDFVFPTEQMKQEALAKGDYIPTNGLPVGIEHYQNKLFVSVPRWRNGE